MVTLPEWLVQVDPHRMIQKQDTQEPGTVAIIAMCGVMGRIISQGRIQEENTGDLGTAIITTCKTLAQLYPQRQIQQWDAAPLDRGVVAKIIDFLGKPNET